MSNQAHDDHALVPGQESTHHVTPIGTFVGVFFILFILMVATIAAAEIGSIPTLLANVIAMAIALTKASLVVAYFMGVKYTTQLAKIYAIGGFIWVTLLMIAFCDYITRKDEPAPAWLPSNHSQQTDMQLPEAGRELPRQYFGSP